MTLRLDTTNTENDRNSLTTADALHDLKTKPIQVSPGLRRFVHQSDFDGRGAIHWIGETDADGEPAAAWTNPGKAGRVGVTWGEPSYGEAEDALNRAVEGECEAAAQANAYYAFDLKTYAVNPTHYTIRHGLQDGRRRLQNWHLQVRRKRRQRKWIRERKREMYPQFVRC